MEYGLLNQTLYCQLKCVRVVTSISFVSVRSPWILMIHRESFRVRKHSSYYPEQLQTLRDVLKWSGSSSLQDLPLSPSNKAHEASITVVMTLRMIHLQTKINSYLCFSNIFVNKCSPVELSR